MSVYNQSSVGIDPKDPYLPKLLKFETNENKDQVTFYVILEHDSGHLPEGTTIQVPFVNAVNSKDGTRDPIWFDWKPKTGVFAFTMEIKQSPNSDEPLDYLFETNIVAPDGSLALLTFKAQMAKPEHGPKVTLISASIVDDELKVITAVTRDDGRPTRRAFASDKRMVECVWDSLAGELTTSFKLVDLTGKLVEVDIDYSIGILESAETTIFNYKDKTSRTKTLRTTVIGSFVENDKLTFTTQFNWKSSGKPPKTLSVRPDIAFAENVPSGTIKLTDMGYDSIKGTFRASYQVIGDSDNTMEYTLGLFVACDEFDPVVVELKFVVPPRKPKFEFKPGEPFLQAGKLLLPFEVFALDSGEKVPAETLNDYQDNPFMSKGFLNPRAPTVKPDKGKTYLTWNVNYDNMFESVHSALGVYKFGDNRFLYDFSITLKPIYLESLTTEVKTADIIETLTLSRGYPIGTISIQQVDDPLYETELIHKEENVVAIVFKGAARTLSPTKRTVGARLILGDDYSRTLHFNDTVKLFMKPGEGNLVANPVVSRQVNPTTIEVVSSLRWEDGTHPLNVIMDDVIQAANGPIRIRKWEYDNKEGLLRYYVKVAPSGNKEEYLFVAQVQAPDYGIDLGGVETRLTIGSDLYPFTVGEVKSALVGGNVVSLEFPVTYKNGTKVKNLTEILSLEEVYPNIGYREHSDFQFVKSRGVVKVNVSVGSVTWGGSHFELGFRFQDDRDEDTSDKLASVRFQQVPKFDASITYAGMVHGVQNGKYHTEVCFSIERHDGGMTEHVKLVGGEVGGAEIIEWRPLDGIEVGAIKLALTDGSHSQPIKGHIDFEVDGNLLTLELNEIYRVPGEAEYKGMVIGSDPERPLEVTWIIGDWSSEPPAHISLNDRLWKGLSNTNAGTPVAEWNQVTHELTVKFPAKVDNTTSIRYTGNNIFMLPSPDMTTYPISFDDVIHGTAPKEPFLSARTNWNPTIDRNTGEMTFRYKLANTNGNLVGKVECTGIRFIHSGPNASSVPVVFDQKGDSINVTINPGENTDVVMFDIDFKSENAPNTVTVRDHFCVTNGWRNPEFIHAEILPKTDTMRVYWYNPGMDTTDLDWSASKDVRLAKTGVVRDDRTNILYSDFVVYMDTKKDIRHALIAEGPNGVQFRTIATIFGTEKPHNRMQFGTPTVKVTDELVEYVYPTTYEGTKIGPEDVTAEIVGQSGAFKSFTCVGNAIGKTITLRFNKYDPPYPTGFKISVRLRSGIAKKPTTFTIDIN